MRSATASSDVTVSWLRRSTMARCSVREGTGMAASRKAPTSSEGTAPGRAKGAMEIEPSAKRRYVGSISPTGVMPSILLSMHEGTARVAVRARRRAAPILAMTQVPGANVVAPSREAVS
ncbi:hypothetical protein FM110_12460 [Brachybacterium nesterenkovii]|uniref:Uncharacterized protein n=1 Tax=Brachybacterium nesterenkovii TaxID=47847 RepID=A0A1X6X7M8_9MICO|nr:hypothetical protein FM110_12460 [Brachybacterium nesterenkovii]